MQAVRFLGEDGVEFSRPFEPYLDEIGRQAEIASRKLASAWTAAMQGEDPRDPDVWSDLQSALMSGIVISRILQPGDVHGRYPGLSRSQSKEWARNRGERLRELLGVNSDAGLFQISAIRDPFEHFDERLDRVIVGGADCIADWYITDGPVLASFGEGESRSAVGLRCFYPANGLLIYDGTALDMFMFDRSMLDLLALVPQAKERAQQGEHGRGKFGGHELVRYGSGSEAYQRCREWLAFRAQRGHQLPVTLPDEPWGDWEESTTPA
jgi:hypothetical protein